jgi:hypothetical protein
VPPAGRRKIRGTTLSASTVGIRRTKASLIRRRTVGRLPRHRDNPHPKRQSGLRVYVTERFAVACGGIGWIQLISLLTSSRNCWSEADMTSARRLTASVCIGALACGPLGGCVSGMRYKLPMPRELTLGTVQDDPAPRVAGSRARGNKPAPAVPVSAPPATPAEATPALRAGGEPTTSDTLASLR